MSGANGGPPPSAPDLLSLSPDVVRELATYEKQIAEAQQKLGHLVTSFEMQKIALLQEIHQIAQRLETRTREEAQAIDTSHVDTRGTWHFDQSVGGFRRVQKG